MMTAVRRTRLSAVEGLAVERIDSGDEIRVSWDALDPSDLEVLGSNALKARLTVIVEGGGVDNAMNVALGDTSFVVEDVEFTKELTVSVAMTLGDYVISDIAEADFKSGMPAPSFKTVVLANGDDADYGDFYFLGFNDLFDNWYVSTDTGLTTSPASPKFRVGLQHGDEDLAPDDADFDHYRINIVDSDGDSIGYLAKTVAASSTYSGNVITFGGTDAVAATVLDSPDGPMTNVRLSSRADGGPRSPYYEDSRFTSPTNPGLAFGNVTASPTAAGILYANPPAEYYDFPKDIFDGDGNYTINAWAENEDGSRISSEASVLLSVREGAGVVGARFSGYTGGVRVFPEESVVGVNLAFWGLTVQDN